MFNTIFLILWWEKLIFPNNFEHFEQYSHCSWYVIIELCVKAYKAHYRFWLARPYHILLSTALLNFNETLFDNFTFLSTLWMTISLFTMNLAWTNLCQSHEVSKKERVMIKWRLIIVIFISSLFHKTAQIIGSYFTANKFLGQFLHYFSNKYSGNQLNL